MRPTVTDVTLNSQSYGLLPNGQSVEAWTLGVPHGLTLEVITYGGIVTRLLVPDRHGTLDDVVLGCADLNSYLAGHPYFGAITGRVAGRIAGAAFRLEGKTYELAHNDPPNHLHGGIQGFDKKVWNAMPVDRTDGAPSLRLAYRSPDGEEGYPGNVDVTVTYTVTHDNTFLIETHASTDRPTPFNLTNHSYFNLAGESVGSIEDHELQVFAGEFVAADESMTLLGRLESVSGRDNDFRRPRQLGEAIPQLHQNHGDLYLLSGNATDSRGANLVRAAQLVHPGSGRVLSVFTTETYMQFYTGSHLDGSITGKSGAKYARYSGLCLECHGYPDGVSKPQLGDIILSPGAPQHRVTAYAFSTTAELGPSTNG
ncbi:MAG TPA: aldose epimerase family protein [Terracidiphilus sp.]|nr:aldose epimerase family protein [Terracidiphilus sp.]